MLIRRQTAVLLALVTTGFLISIATDNLAKSSVFLPIPFLWFSLFTSLAAHRSFYQALDIAWLQQDYVLRQSGHYQVWPHAHADWQRLDTLPLVPGESRWLGRVLLTAASSFSIHLVLHWQCEQKVPGIWQPMCSARKLPFACIPVACGLRKCSAI